MEDQPIETTVFALSDAPPKAPERRDSERELTLFRVGSLFIDGRRELCLIKNVSAGGMLIRAYCNVVEGARLSIELKHGTPVHGTVAWTRDNSVGVTFDAPIDIVELLASSEDGPRPRMPRVEVETLATIRQDGKQLRLHLRDISQGGVKVEGPQLLELNSNVVVSLRGLAPQPAVVRWHAFGCYGITFNRVLPLSELVAWIHEQRDGTRAAG